MKVKVLKDLNELSHNELKYAFNECAKDVYYSTGQGLDYANAETRMSAIRKELKSRKINRIKFIDEIEADIKSGKM